MDTSLQNLLNLVAEKKTSKTKSYGLTDMTAPSNLWTFKDDNSRQIFWTEYCKLIEKQKNDGKNYNFFLGEVNDESAFISELTFRFMDSEKVRHEEGPFNEKFICDVIECFNRILESNLTLSEDKKELICCVLQSKKIVNDILTPDEVKYTLRIHYPFCRTKVLTQKQILRDLIIKELHVRGPTLDQSALGDWNQRYDPSIPALFVPLFGSKRKASDEPLELTNVFSWKKDEYGLLKEIEIDDIFDPLNHTDVQTGRIDREIFEDDDDSEKWMPLLFSTIYWPTVCKIIQKEIPNSVSQDNFHIQPNQEEPKTATDFLKIFIPMLKEERKDDITVWMDVGKAFYHATNGTVEGLNEWKKYSESSNKFTKEQCEIKYPLFRDSLITYKTIAWHAKDDSPEMYKLWHKSWFKISYDKSVKEPLHTDLAEMFYRKYWLNFAYSSCGKRGSGKTYRFDKNGHRWRQLEDGEITIGKILTDKFLSMFEREKISVNRKLLDMQEGELDQRKKNSKNKKDTRPSKEESDEQSELETIFKNLLKIINILGSVPQKRSVITAIQEKLFIEQFDKNLDTNPMLIGVLNGVIEADNKEARFRKGKPEDYLCMFTSLPYREDFNWGCDSVTRYLKYLNQVFPDKELMKYMRKDIASFLKGRNAEKLFRIFSGCGDNSKSVYIKLVERAFGSYCVSVPVSVITVKRGSSSSASPETARLRGAHIATCAEPDDNETIKAGIVKSMTGNDRFFTRALFSNGEEIEAMYKLILITNKVPSIPNAGKAIKNRVMIIPFLATFVDKDYPEDEDEQYERKTFKKDPDFEDYVPLLSQAMLWCAVQDYQPYCREGLKELPRVIKDETNAYWEENDAYDLFIREKLVKEVIPEVEVKPIVEDIEVIVIDDKECGGNKEGGKDGPGKEGTKQKKQPKSPKRQKKEEPKYTTEVALTDLYRVFKIWVKEAFPGLLPIPDQPQVRTEMVQRLGPQKNRKWVGWSLKEEEANRF
jgi:phage/plasmid-associated DNA primase